MAITVTDEDGHLTLFSATKWVIDDTERLHVIGDEGNIASYNRGAWRSVTKGEPKA